MRKQTQKTEKANHGVQQAESYLRVKIDNYELLPNGHLPSLAKLAEAAQVSRNTMWKAVSELKQKGILTAVRGGRITPASPGQRTSLPFIENPKLWERKRNSLVSDILNGRYNAYHRLPQVKELAAEYRVCKATLKKMLDSLVRQGIIVVDKRAFAIPQPKKKRFMSTVVVLTEPISAHQGAVVVTERMQKLFDTLETDCAQAGLSIEFAYMDLEHPEKTAKKLNAFNDDGSIIGYIVNAWCWPPEYRMLRTLDLIKLAARNKKPIAILDQVGEFSYPAGFFPVDLVRVFRTAGYAAGQTVARFLLQNGHRRIVYLSLQHKHSWSIQRLEGVSDAFNHAGLQKQVAALCENEFVDNFEALYAALGNDEATLRQIYELQNVKTGSTWRMTRYREIQSKNLIPGSDTKMLQQIKTDFFALKGLLDRNISRQMFGSIRNQMHYTLGLQALDSYAEALFNRALAQPGVTAWVGSNDQFALAALRFLRKKGIRVPADISIVGFDNCAAALESDLTSYDFNMAAIAHRMLRFVLRPNDKANAAGSCPIEVDGILIERGSTGKARP
jgi:DNA-binding LacI/PurR family transcriptional regulator/DNA-binding GntR family transcriptional regulator